MLLLAATGIGFYASVQSLLRSRAWVAHTYSVLDTLDKIDSALKGSELQHQDYLLTKAPKYLAAYQTEAEQIYQALNRVRQLTQDNSEQQQRLDRLQPVIQQQLALFQRSLQTSQPNPEAGSQATFLAEGEVLQQITQTLLSELRQTESRLLLQRAVSVDANVQRTLWIGNIGLGLAVVLLIGIYALLRRQIRQREAAELALQQTNLQLETKVQEVMQANAALYQEIEERQRIEKSLQQFTLLLRQSNQELEQFAYVASHDLQEPLRAVTSYTQLLAQKYPTTLDAKTEKYIGYIVDGATRMQQLINDLLTYSRVGRQHLVLQPTDCNAIVDLVCQNLQVAIAESQGSITHDPLPTITADPAQLTQLLQNLVGNALKYRSDQPPHVHISAQIQAETAWVFAVQDNGVGMETKYLERIFVIFQRLHTRRQYPGTGIGLAICKKIVERHGGSIWVESQLGMGSTFYFTIPLSISPQAEVYSEDASSL